MQKYRSPEMVEPTRMCPDWKVKATVAANRIVPISMMTIWVKLLPETRL